MDLKEQYDRLLRYCYMKTKDPHLAEDITQETFLRFWESRSYKDTGKEMAYLYTIARNLCVNEFRKRQYFSIVDQPVYLKGGKPADEEITVRIAVNAAMEKLPEDLREIVALRYVSEVSVSDIGRIMNISRFSVYRRLREGLRLLYEYLK